MDHVIIDGMNRLFAAQSVHGALTTQEGFPTGGIYGFCSMLASLRKQFPTARLHVAWESAGGVAKRREIVSSYKANRGSRTESLDPVLDALSPLLVALGVTQWSAPGFEADDVIAAFAGAPERASQQVLIVSEDRDFLQLVSNQCRVFTPRRKKFYDADAVREEYGVSPEDLVAYRSMLGDKSDNLPGIERLRKKTVVRLIDHHNGDLQAMLGDNAEVTLTTREREKIASSRDLVLKNAQVMRLGVEALDTMQMTEGLFDENSIREICTVLEFGDSTVSRMLSMSPRAGFHARQGTLDALYHLNRPT